MSQDTWSTTPQPRAQWQGHELASFWSRVGAALIDTLVVAPLAILIHTLLTGKPFQGAHATTGAQLGTIAIGVVVAAAYYVPQMIRWRGRTIGKRALRLRVVRASGEEMTVSVAFVREILCKTLGFGTVVIDVFVPGVLIFGMIDDLCVLADGQNRALHDFAAGTRVIREPI